MKNLKKTLALGLMVLLAMSMGIVALAEEEVTLDVPEVSIEQPKPEAAPKAEEPALEVIEPQPETVNEQAGHSEDAGNKQDFGQQASESIAVGSEEPAEAEMAEAGQPAEHVAGEAAPAIDHGANAEVQEETIIEDEQVPLAVRPSTPIDGSVRIFSSIDQPKFGERVQLSSELKGFDGDYTLLFQWQVNKGDGWQNISGANGRTFEFTYSERVQDFRWRLAVNIDE